MTECAHGLERDWCSLCKAPPGSLPVPDLPAGVIGARWYGRCGACDQSIYAGDPIVRDTDDQFWIHQECAT